LVERLAYECLNHRLAADIQLLGGAVQFFQQRDTSVPWSARWAMASADSGLRGLRVFFIKFVLLLRGFAESDEVEYIRALVEIVWV
jgi:hypothetical protein